MDGIKCNFLFLSLFFNTLFSYFLFKLSPFNKVFTSSNPAAIFAIFSNTSFVIFSLSLEVVRDIRGIINSLSKILSPPYFSKRASWKLKKMKLLILIHLLWRSQSRTASLPVHVSSEMILCNFGTCIYVSRIVHNTRMGRMIWTRPSTLRNRLPVFFHLCQKKRRKGDENKTA